MKTVLIIICFVALSFTGKAQYKKDSTDMSTRLETFMQYNRLMDIDKVLDYTYPKLFTIAPREQVKEAMEKYAKEKSMALVGYCISYMSIKRKAEAIVTDAEKVKNDFYKLNSKINFGKDNIIFISCRK